eukprot:2193539-Prymnesium_polylepis.1
MACACARGAPDARYTRARRGLTLASAVARAASVSVCLSGCHSSARCLYAALISICDAMDGTCSKL